MNSALYMVVSSVTRVTHKHIVVVRALHRKLLLVLLSPIVLLGLLRPNRPAKLFG